MAEGKVLVADDEEYIRDVVSSALRIAGFETMTAIDGFEVCRRLRADGDATPVVFLTARDANEDRISGLTKGGDDYLTKPSASRS